MLSLYVHIPFCVKKCRYCGFYSTKFAETAAGNYLSALEREAAATAASFSGRTIETVYIGGGTPTVLSPVQLHTLLSILKRHFAIASGAEWTIEANPCSATPEKLALLKEMGVTRLSLGVQALSDPLLAFLERPHTASDAVRAFRAARKAGFDNLALDVICGIPDHTEGEWRSTLEQIAELGPEHISVYILSLDDGSRLKAESDAGRVVMPDDDVIASRYEAAQGMLSSAGYGQYEISNFCRPGYACRHNMQYWQRGEYLGLGAGAWSFVSGKRYRNAPDLRAYCLGSNAGAPPRTDEETPDQDTASRETVMLALRTAGGLDLVQYEHAFGSRMYGKLQERIERFRGSDLLHLEKGHVCLSPRGFLLAHEVLVRLFA